MAEFQYSARDASGNLIDGRLSATNTDGVASQLFQKGLTPISIRKSSRRLGVRDILSKDITPKKIKPAEMVIFCRQMATLLKAGVPILDSLNRLATTTRTASLSKAVKGVADHVASGQTLTSGLKLYPAVFNNVFASMIEAGEQSGQLERAFEQLVDYFDLESRTGRQLKSATRYPMMVVIAMVIAIGVINFFVIPSFASMFKQMGGELPLPTRMLMGMSNFMVTNWWLLLIIIIVIVAALKYWLKTPAGRVTWDRIHLKIPIFGNITHRVIIARFARIFTMTIRSGLPLVPGLELVAKTVGNAYMSALVLSMREGIERGESLVRAATKTKMFSSVALQMISVGEAAGAVDDMLEEIAKYYEREVDYDLGRLGQMIEPIMIVVIGIMVLILALGVFLPMWDMVQFAHQ